METEVRGKRRAKEDLPAGAQADGAGGEYCETRVDTEESAAESTKWSGDETTSLESKQEAETAGDIGEVGMKLTAT